MVKIKEAIVVEGKYDKNALKQLVDTAVFTTNGFGIMHDKVQLKLLRQVAQTRGLIVLTDADGAGFVIRNKLKGALGGRVLHAYIPDIYGKEKRKDKPGKEGKLGVEGMRPEIILEALRKAGATIEGEQAAGVSRITKQDLMALGLSGGPNSSEKRLALLKQLKLPEHMSANAMLEALNLLYTLEELTTIVEALETKHG